MNAVQIMAWPKEDLEARFIKSARLLHIWGHLTDAELQRVLSRVTKKRSKGRNPKQGA